MEYKLINIDLRFDSKRGVVTGAVGRFHRSPSQYEVVTVDGLSLSVRENLDWNAIRNRLYAQYRKQRK